LKILNRATGVIEEEKIFGEKAIRLLYGGGIMGSFLAHLSARLPFVSAFYGWLQKRPGSKKKVAPFIEQFGVNSQEFLIPADQFASFNDFFIRKLNPRFRPIAKTDAVCPVDGRYRIYPDLSRTSGFWVKGEKFTLESFLDNPDLAQAYAGGTLILARLAPPDYHRFHFPVDGVASPSQLINGYLYSVNPIALKKDITILSKNKRRLTRIESPHLGEVLMLEVGATNVGSIHETYIPNAKVAKGEEKGYFSFGASLVALLFKPNRLQLEADLLKASLSEVEIFCKMGEPLGNQRRI
jgi:phosphatidylserine decarboxylase